MSIIGLTGSIAAGKSTASAMLKGIGVHIIDADLIAREATNDKNCLFKIRESFGDSVFNGDELNRKALGGIIFSNSQKRIELNAIVHPYVKEQIELRAREKESEGKLCIIDAPLLFEVGLHKLCKKVIVVVADDELRIRRIMARDGLSSIDAMARMSCQLSQKEKMRLADFIIDNSSDILSLEGQVFEIIERIKEHE